MKNFDQQYSELYKASFGQLTAALLAIFRLRDLSIAEDLVQETFVAAYHHWKQHGFPDQPTAWLRQVCKNKTINFLTRNRYQLPGEFYLSAEKNIALKVDQIFLPDEIKDQQLRLLFACCHPNLSSKAQLIFTLIAIGGLRISEIARALGEKEDTVSKMWRRTKQKLRADNLPLHVPFVRQSLRRLDIVHTVLYLMFNEGYSASGGDQLIRKDLCLEAIRLTKIIADNKDIVRADTYALLALMLFGAARFDSRINGSGGLIDLARQDRKQWDQTLIKLGMHYLGQARDQPKLSRWIIEATIASVHVQSDEFEATDWTLICHLYRLLLSHTDSIFVRLNLAIATYYAQGATTALSMLQQLESEKNINGNHLFHATLGKIYADLKCNQAARTAYRRAYALTRIESEKQFLQEQLAALD